MEKKTSGTVMGAAERTQSGVPNVSARSVGGTNLPKEMAATAVTAATAVKVTTEVSHPSHLQRLLSK